MYSYTTYSWKKNEGAHTSKYSLKGTIKNKNGRKTTPKKQGNSHIFRTCYDLFSVVGV